MRMAKDRNLLQNIKTMNREELEKNFSFIKDDLIEQTDLYDLNIKQDTQTNNDISTVNQNISEDVTVQGQTAKSKGKVANNTKSTKQASNNNANNNTNNANKSVVKQATKNYSNEAKSQVKLQRMHNKISSEESSRINENNRLSVLDPSQKKDKLKQYSLAKLLELKYNPTIAVEDISGFIDEEIKTRQDYLREKKTYTNDKVAISNSLNNGKLTKLNTDILEAYKDLGQSERLAQNKEFHPQDVLNTQIKSALRLDPHNKVTLEEVKQALLNLPLFQRKKEI